MVLFYSTSNESNFIYFSGCIVYRCYAYKYSNERRFASSNILTFTQASTDQNCSEVIPILLASEDATQ